MKKYPKSFPDNDKFTTIFDHPKLDKLIDILTIISIIYIVILLQKTCCIDLLVTYIKVKILKLPNNK